MRLRAPRLAMALLGDRLAVAAVSGDTVQAFTVEAEDPAAALRAELDARGLAPRGVALALGRAMAAVKPIELPAVAGDVRDMVRFELDRHLPFPAEDAAFDVAALPADAATRGDPTAPRRVLVVAADRRIIDRALEMATAARLRPTSLTVAPLDLLSLATPARGQRVVWVHRSGTAADLLFLSGSALVSSRNVAGDDDMVADEIRKSLVAVRWRGCDAIWVSGDDADEALHGELARIGAPATEPAWSSRAKARVEALPDEQRGSLTLALAVASAGRAPAFDLLPQPLRPRRLTRAQGLTLAMGVLTAVLVIGALLVPTLREARHLRRVDAEIARLDPEVRAVERVVREVDRKKKLLATIDGLDTGAPRPLVVLRELTELLPSDAWLTTVSLDAKGVEITGQANSASGLIPILENSPRFERVEFASPVTRGRDREQFRIKAAWETTSPVTAATTPPTPVGPGRAGPGAPPRASAPRATPPPDVDADEPPPGVEGPAPQPRRPMTPGTGGRQ